MKLHGSTQFQARTTGGARSLAKEPVPARVPEREVGKRMAAAKLQPHSSYVKASDRPGLCRSSRGRLKPSNAAPGSRMCCHTRVQGFASVPKREVGGRFEREKGGKEGKWSQSCEHFGERVGSGKVAAVPQREVTRRTGRSGPVAVAAQPHRSKQFGGRSGRVRQAESPLQDGGVRDGASGVGGPLGVGNRRRARRLSRGRCSQFQVGRRPGRFDCTTEPGSSRCAGSRWL